MHSPSKSVNYLLMALQSFLAARLLPSSTGRGNLRTELLLGSLVNPDGFDIDRISPLLLAVLNKESDRVI